MKPLAIAGMVMGFIGFGLLLWLNAYVALGVFLCLMGNNLERSNRT